jgi:hypothetical protein
MPESGITEKRKMTLTELLSTQMYIPAMSFTLYKGLNFTVYSKSNKPMNLLIKTALISLAASSFVSTSPAQEQTTEQKTPPKSICESMDAFNDFDFWIGEWNVYTNDEERKFQGTNSVSKHHKNCLIMENWTNAQGGKGSSMNYFDPVENQWRQLWVAGGYSIDYTGGLDETGSMILKGKINYYQTGKSNAFRGKWIANSDGTVRQFFEQQDAETGEWGVWFDGLYIKQTESQ